MTDYQQTNSDDVTSDYEQTNGVEQTWAHIVDNYDQLMRRLAAGPDERSEAR